MEARVTAKPNSDQKTQQKMNNRNFTTVLLACLAVFANAYAESSDLMQGKVKTDHTIRLEKIVDAPPSEVFKMWTSAKGVKKFFAPDARIGTKPGEEYTILFFPKEDPEGLVHGTKGARILELVPDRKIAFEWITFAGDNLKGPNAPPYASPELRNQSPLPTWVEMTFENSPGNRTKITFRHYGFQDGELWAKSQSWFTTAWSAVLDQLAATVAKKKDH
jgi:uncharacterized protein YndB with AHSA1/START domain